MLARRLVLVVAAAAFAGGCAGSPQAPTQPGEAAPSVVIDVGHPGAPPNAGDGDEFAPETTAETAIAGVSGDPLFAAEVEPLVAERDDANGLTRTVGLSGEASAATPAPRFVTIETRAGAKIRGHLVADDGQRITVSFEVAGGGAAVVQLRYGQLHPRTVYRLKLARTTSEDGKGQLALARMAAEQGLFDPAMRHYLKAAAADDALGTESELGLAELREDVADARLQRARAAVSRGQARRATTVLDSILQDLPDTAAAMQAAEFLAVLSAPPPEPEDLTDEQVAAVFAPLREDLELVSEGDAIS